MSNYNQVSYGSKGSDVTELQKLLNKNGYKLDEDGIFGDITKAAVLDYQKKNNLTVDGIVGKNTWGALTGVSTATSTTPTTETTPQFEYSEYKPSDAVTQAEQLLQQWLSQKPGEYQSQWNAQLNDIMNQILNRKDFSYDLNGDALYQQYKDKYIQQGKMAMMDTMGQAQAMTGGYGNSYAQSAGQQAYQGQLQNLNDVVPELYQMAYDQYMQQGQDMMNQYAMLSAQDAQDYGRYRDSVSDYYTELDRLSTDSRYKSEQDYSRYTDGRDFQYDMGRDAVADEQWQKEFEEGIRRFNTQYGIDTGTTGTDGVTKPGNLTLPPAGSDDTSRTPHVYDTYHNGSVSTENIKALQKALGITADGKWGPASQDAAKKKWGVTSADDALKAYNKNAGNNSYYDQLLGAVSTAKGAYGKQDAATRQKAYRDAVDAINDAYKSGKITAEEKAQLLRIATPSGR